MGNCNLLNCDNVSVNREEILTTEKSYKKNNYKLSRQQSIDKTNCQLTTFFNSNNQKNNGRNFISTSILKSEQILKKEFNLPTPMSQTLTNPDSNTSSTQNVNMFSQTFDLILVKKIQKNFRLHKSMITHKNTSDGREIIDGLNRLKFLTGEDYFGNIYLQKMDGIGRYANTTGSTYEGYFSQDMINGFGIEKWYDGSEFIGEFKNNVKEGYGVLKFEDGSYYEGEFLDNDINGYGSFFKKDGICQEGFFSKNKLNGYGIIKTSQGKLYEGEILNDRKDGFGIQFELNKTKNKIYIGKWKNSKLEGEVIVKENGEFRKYIYKNSTRIQQLPDNYYTIFDEISKDI